MLRTLNTYALIGSAVALSVCFWNRNEIPTTIAFDSRLENAPKQRTIVKQPFDVSYSGIEYRVEPRFDYELYGLVVSYRQHDGKSFMHRTSNDRLNMADICVVWSDTAFSEHLRKLDFWNGIFTCNVSTRDSVAWAHFKLNELSNNHLISADAVIRDRVSEIHIGDQIRIKGWLANYGAAGGGMRRTSTKREDTGDGACETIFVNEFDILTPAWSLWRVNMHVSLAVLAVCLAVHFALPYRPNQR
jgi:hypothetical protein